MNNDQFNQELLDFLGTSPSQYHAVRAMEHRLLKADYQRLYEHESWRIDPQGKYYVIRNDASLIAFTAGDLQFEETGFRMIGAHTDSPGLKLKPSPDVTSKSFFQTGVEVYGGPLLNSWFDRELSLAGRVSWVEEASNGEVRSISTLVDFNDPLAIIPNLAIHLDREANSKKSINKQTDLPPILLLSGETPPDFRSILEACLNRTGVTVPDKTLMDYDLFFYDTTRPLMTGLNTDFITGGKLDNLVSCFTGLSALTASTSALPSLLICNDHEEVGSVSSSGASGTFLSSVLRRLSASSESYARMIDRSLLISADNAHGLHPNHQDKYEGNHAPLLNGGPVIKINANQRYATDCMTGSAFRYLSKKAGVPVQEFVVRTDMACGSTIGPLTAGETGLRTVDAGIPMLAMHSIRETIGSNDAFHFFQVLKTHYETWIRHL